MRLVTAILTLVALSLGLVRADAQSQPVVVELYTSQGCSSCPPADDILTDLAKRNDVIALALHVDYWDYLGWRDGFASAAFSRRQRAYAAASKKNTVYTPQMIVQGHSYAVGNRIADVRGAIAMHRNDPPAVDLDLSRQGDQLVIVATAKTGDVGRVVIQVVRYTPQAVVQIKAGENAGRKILYTNIVTQWSPVTRWNGRGSISTRTAMTGDDKAVVLVQTDGYGPILAAQQLP